MRRRKRLLQGILRGGTAVLLILSLLTTWTHFGRGPGAPRIGLSVSEDWYDRSQLNPAALGLALSRVGANVRDLRPSDLPALDRLLDDLDGLVLVGGMDDVDPSLYGGDPRKARGVERERDDFELELLRRAERRGMPVLGICRGAQLLAVAYGGSLRPLEGSEAERHGVSIQSLSAHEVRVDGRTGLGEMIGRGPFRVSSTHLQAIAEAGPLLRVAARSEDGVIEAVELPGSRLVLGLQWHPEWEPLAGERSLAPFRALVAASRRGGI